MIGLNAEIILLRFMGSDIYLGYKEMINNDINQIVNYNLVNYLLENNFKRIESSFPLEFTPRFVNGIISKYNKEWAIYESSLENDALEEKALNLGQECREIYRRYEGKFGKISPHF